MFFVLFFKLAALSVFFFIFRRRNERSNASLNSQDLNEKFGLHSLHDLKMHNVESISYLFSIVSSVPSTSSEEPVLKTVYELEPNQTTPVIFL